MSRSIRNITSSEYREYIDTMYDLLEDAVHALKNREWDLLGDLIEKFNYKNTVKYTDEFHRRYNKQWVKILHCYDAYYKFQRKRDILTAIAILDMPLPFALMADILIHMDVIDTINEVLYEYLQRYIQHPIDEVSFIK